MINDLAALHADRDTCLTGETRYKVVRGIFRSRVFLEVEYRDRETDSWSNRNLTLWRLARAGDIELLAQVAHKKWQRRMSDKKVTVGQRVRANLKAGFHKGAEGVVVFQEPCGGVLWVRRDGTDSPVFYYLEELDLIRPKRQRKMT